jgi:small subunit ribosomal protein S6
VRRYLLRSYQSVLILKPDIDEPRVDEALEKIGEFIKSYGGACLKVEKWGKKRLGYRVKKNRFGIYLNIYHTLESANVKDLEIKFKLYDLVIKFMVLRLEDDELERALGKEDIVDDEEAVKKVDGDEDDDDKDS